MNAGETFKKVIDRIAALEMIKQAPHWDAGAYKDRRSPKDLRIRVNDTVQFHSPNVSSPNQSIQARNQRRLKAEGTN
jgi:hypothetical protein